ncbi:hypothetical protein M1146_04140 [Patescibacteria group bacterium]|nr:hypothetical protein [Patescibacteria group bacterium]
MIHFILHPSSFILHPSSFILHPSSFTLCPLPFTLHTSSFTLYPLPFTLHLHLHLKILVVLELDSYFAYNPFEPSTPVPHQPTLKGILHPSSFILHPSLYLSSDDRQRRH